MHAVVKSLNVRARVFLSLSICSKANPATVFCEKEEFFLSSEIIFSRISTMADVPMHMGCTRKMSYGSYNGKMSGVEGKTPFLIGVSGGTASGKVSRFF